MSFDIRFHPKSFQLGITKTKEGPYHIDLPSEWTEHFLVVRFGWISIDLDWNSYPS